MATRYKIRTEKDISDADLTNLGNLSGINTGDQDLSGLVPYTGATADVDLGEHNLTIGSSNYLYTANISSVAGQNLNFKAANSAVSGNAGQLLQFYAGHGLGAGAGGNTQMFGGDGGAIGNGGEFNMRGGSGGVTSGNGGLAYMAGGDASTGNGGDAELYGGSASVAGNGGNVNFYVGTGAGAGVPGDYKFWDDDINFAGILNFRSIATSDKTFTFPNASGTLALTSDLAGYALIDQTMYIGTTAVAINRGSGALTLAGITLTTPNIGTPSAGTLTNCTGLPAAAVVAGTFVANMEASDHGTAATDQLVNVCYGTGDPPAANTTTEGTLFIKYTA